MDSHLQIDGPFKFNEFVSSVKLPKAHEAIPYHRKALASGWGLTSAVSVDFIKFQTLSFT